MADPQFLYGTAWKEDETERLTRLAIAAGFDGIDTANQRKHYFEAAVGQALVKYWEAGDLSRADLFLQTKFTYERGQDHRLPYDAQADLTTQVEQSFNSSLEHLHTDYLDSYVLHGPASSMGLIDADWEVWRAMEELHTTGRARRLGISNVRLDQLQELLRGASVKPSFVQNRCYARTGWDAEIRRLCREHDVVYQGFSLLTANRAELATPAMREIAARHKVSVPQVVFAFSRQVGMLPLTGTTNEEHMRQDLESVAVTLSEHEIGAIEHISTGSR